MTFPVKRKVISIDTTPLQGAGQPAFEIGEEVFCGATNRGIEMV